MLWVTKAIGARFLGAIVAATLQLFCIVQAEALSDVTYDPLIILLSIAQNIKYIIADNIDR